MTTTAHSADKQTLQTVLSACRATRLPSPGLVASFVGETVSDEGETFKIFIRSTLQEVDGVVSWTETTP